MNIRRGFRGQPRWLVNTETNLTIIGNVFKVSYMADIIKLNDSESVVGRLWQTITSLNPNFGTQMRMLPLSSENVHTLESTLNSYPNV